VPRVAQVDALEDQRELRALHDAHRVDRGVPREAEAAVLEALGHEHVSGAVSKEPPVCVVLEKRLEL
jgi:hypothetical protein